MEKPSLSAIALATISVLYGRIRIRQPGRSQDGFGVLQDFSQFLCGNVAKVQNLLVIFDVVNRFQGCGFGELGRYANVGRNRYRSGFINQICFAGFTDVVALSGNEGSRPRSAGQRF